MLKTMYEQFIQGENAILVRNGYYPRTLSTKVKYYKYQSQDKKKHMCVMVDVNSNFSPHDLPTYVAQSLVTIRYIEFSEI